MLESVMSIIPNIISKSQRIINVTNIIPIKGPIECDEYWHYNQRRDDIFFSSHAPPAIQLGHQKEMQPHTAWTQMTASDRSQGHLCTPLFLRHIYKRKESKLPLARIQVLTFSLILGTVTLKWRMVVSKLCKANPHNTTPPFSPSHWNDV